MKLHTRDRPIWVPVDRILRRKMVPQSLAVNPAELREEAVQRGNIVPLRKKEVVAIGIVYAGNTEKSTVEIHNHVHG